MFKTGQNNMKKYIGICVVIFCLITVWYYLRHPLVPRIQIRHSIYTVELAITEAEKERGLGYRDRLDENHGMLFPYDHAEKFSFWMKGMSFPIDIIWIRDQKIVDISKNVPVATSSVLPIYSPREPVNQVLEVAAGTSERNGIQIGDLVMFLKN
jgi:uncharacterized protein